MIVMSLTLLMAVPTSVSAQATPPSGDHPYAPHTGNAIYNYTTADSSDIKKVAISPDGDWIAAASNTKTLYVFSSASGSGGSITPAVTTMLASDVGAMALSNSGPGGSPLLVIGFGAILSVYNVSSSTHWWNFTAFTNILSPSVTVSSVAISNDGTAIAAVASVSNRTIPTFYTFVYFKNGNLSNQWNSSSYSTATDVSMDVDGTRAIVGANTNDAASVELFDPLTAPPIQWDPTSTYGPTYGLTDALISGDGASMFAITSEGFSAATVAHPQETTAMAALSDANMLSVSYSGCEVLIGMGTSANFYDASRQNVSNCAMASFATPVWSASYQSTVYSLSLASNHSRYFVVAWGNELQWYYEYTGMPSCSEVAYRTATTIGGIESVALSSNGGTVAVGSAFIVGGGNEFVLATDVGIPPLTAVTIRPSSYDLSAGETANFTAIPEITGGACPTGIAYSWTLSNSLGTLNSTTTNPVQFTAGSAIGNVTLSLNATQNGVTKESPNVPITIIPKLSTVAVSPASAELTPAGTQTFTATPECTGGSCPSGTNYTWSLSNDYGRLEATDVPSKVIFVAKSPSGSDTLSVSATLNGVTKQGGPVVITITSNLTVSTFIAEPASIVIGSWTNFTATPNGGIGVLSFNYTGLPSGCSSANQYMLACHPTAVGRYNVTVTVTDQANHSASRSTMLTVSLIPPTNYSVTFAETGLPSGTNWSVSMGGVQHSSSDTSIVFMDPNGAYQYTVVAVPGYAASPSSGSATVSGKAVTIVIQFTATSPTNGNGNGGTKILGLTSTDFYLLVAGVAAAVVVVVAMLYLLRRKSKSGGPDSSEEKIRDAPPSPEKETDQPKDAA